MGLLFDIKRYAVHDGPGIRCSLFFKGCPLHCAWCHNPESQSHLPQVLFNAAKCLGCGQCHRHTLPDNCPSLALERCGQEYSLESVMEIIERERVFFDHSGGGVTFTGGEPLAQSTFLLQLLKACGNKGIHRAVDTCLFADASTVEAVIPYTDLFLLDLKVMDTQRHQKFTGVDNLLIQKNMRLVASSGVPFCIRIPYVGGVNDLPEEETAMRLFILELKELGHLNTVTLLPYHNYGRSKWQRLNPGVDLSEDPFYTPTQMQIAQLLGQLRNAGIPAER